jgi:hypothetical protein
MVSPLALVGAPGFDQIEPDTRLVVGVHPGLGHFEPDLLVVALLVDPDPGVPGGSQPAAPRSLHLILQGANRLFYGILHWSRPRRPRPGHRGGWTWPGAGIAAASVARACALHGPAAAADPAGEVQARAVTMAAYFRGGRVGRNVRTPGIDGYSPRVSSMSTSPAGRVA